MNHLLASRRATTSAAAIDLHTGRLVVRNAGVAAYAASIVKVSILVALQRRERRAGHGLTASQRSAARSMIEASDNDTTTTLWRDAGGARALFRLFRRLGMAHTVPAATVLEPWDGVRTTAADQLRLLHALATRLPGITAKDRRYVLHLMRHVEPAQSWGVSTGTRPEWRVAVKNGWLPLLDGSWTVNSIGIVRGRPHHRYALAVLSTGSPSEPAGIRLVGTVARSVAHRWG